MILQSPPINNNIENDLNNNNNNNNNDKNDDKNIKENAKSDLLFAVEYNGSLQLSDRISDQKIAQILERASLIT